MHCTVQKVVEQEPTATMLQLDAPRGNVNTVVNDSIRATYPVRFKSPVIYWHY